MAHFCEILCDRFHSRYANLRVYLNRNMKTKFGISGVIKLVCLQKKTTA